MKKTSSNKLLLRFPLLSLNPSVYHPNDVVDRALEPNLRDYIRDMLRSKGSLSSSMFAGLYWRATLKSSVISLL